MCHNIGPVIEAAIAYDCGDAKRIHHFLKVYAFAKAIGEGEKLSADLQWVLEAAAVLHDIGIHAGEQKHGSSAGKWQQLEGPPIAHSILESLGYDEPFMERVCYLVGHHHTYTGIVGDDYQILVEADFLVNIFEDGMGEKEITMVMEKYFRTKTGISCLKNLYLKDVVK